ncbi:MAG: hypothetical protein R3A44_32015 [Caldilineaceae bacterium]
MISNQSMDWYVVDEDLPDGADRLIFAETQRNASPPTGGKPQNGSLFQNRIYELAIAFVCIYTLSAFLAWQMVERRMSSLENELLALDAALAKQQTSADAASPLDEPARAAVRQTLETDLLRFEFAEAEAQTVRTIAAQCNEKYGELRADFGLPLASVSQKLTIAVVDPSVQYARHAENTLNIPIPESEVKRYNITETAALRNEIYMHLTRRVMAEALSARQIKPQWLSLVGAMGYSYWVDHNHDSQWRQKEFYLARRYDAQTRSLKLTYAPVAYDQQTQEQFIHTSFAESVSDPLIEYILATYGHAYIAPLLDAFEEHESWETLAPALFHLSEAELEAQWHDYLAQTYPIQESK